MKNIKRRKVNHSGAEVAEIAGQLQFAPGVGESSIERVGWTHAEWNLGGKESLTQTGKKGGERFQRWKENSILKSQ